MGRWTIIAILILGLSACADTTGGSDASDPCTGISCSGQGICFGRGEETFCRCNAGFHADGLECLADLCRDEQCVHGHCKDSATSSECVCDEGYAGPLCDDCAEGYAWDELRCTPAAGCAGVECGRGDCVAEDGAVRCDCDEGWAGDACERCADTYHEEAGECYADTPCRPDPCAHGRCREAGESFVCQCDAGYAGERCDQCAEGWTPEGLVCAPSSGDPCAPNPCNDPNKTLCEIVAGLAVCRCDAGYHENDGGQCVEDTSCDPVTTCSSHGACTGNGLECACEAGYAGANCNICAEGYVAQDDVCVPDADNPCVAKPCTEPDTQCVADGDSYRCECAPGYDAGAGACAARCDVDAERCAFAKPSFGYLVSANGYGAAVADLDARKLADFYVHPYKTWGPTEQGEARTREMLYDSYFGLRADGAGTWLNEFPLAYSGYYGQDGILHWVQQIGSLRVETFAYAPWELGRPAVVMLCRVTNTGDAPQTVSIYSLHNYYVGRTDSPSDPTPDNAGERIVYQPASGAYLETGPGGALVHYPLGAPSRHGTNSVAEADPWQRLRNEQDLGDERDSGVGANKVCGFQTDLTLEAGATGWAGVVSAFEADGTLGAALAADVEEAFAGLASDAVLARARAEWDAWRTPPPPGLSAAERWVYRVGEAVLRMGQVWEPNGGGYAPHGQILAALWPGEWATTWIRDMSYAAVALAKSGHQAEAKAALEFVLTADAGYYQTEVGEDYQVSVCRYYGNGREESDSNENGPNIEFDGFGLFLWALGEYLDAGGDTAFLTENWELVAGKVGDVLAALTAANGMIQADSSIWETHWNGKQKQYVYTSLATARGLCDASRLAVQVGDDARRDAWQAEAQGILAGIAANALDGGFIVQSVEEYESGAGYVDAAVVEAFNWGLFDPAGNVAQATFERLDDALKVAHGYGYMRNDDGGAYDSREWVFIDLRLAHAWREAGRSASADLLDDWITAQGVNNLGLLAELHHPESGDYLLWSGRYGMGSAPMVGFGAGAYLLNAWQRAAGSDPPAGCGLDE
ncbi:MAG: hypothetical protein C4523_07415 [Myxococcales bacterium]|nr:MAG: hypothetical protein C4523_07415 [Myxococcales bacterium]